jgi:hypothetical protein
MPYRLDPQVAGELGERTVMDASTHPPIVPHVDYVLDYPDADDLIQSFPVFLVSEGLAQRMTRARLTGPAFEDVTVRPSKEYRETYGRAKHRRYRRLIITGTGDDCWLDNDHQLCVSDRMMRLLEDADIGGCDIEQIGPE